MNFISADASYCKFEELASFLADFFEDEPFYKLIEGDNKSRKKIIAKMFKNTLEACIEDGYVHVVEDNNRIIAASIWADYNSMFSRNPEGFDRIFNCDKKYLTSLGITEKNAFKMIATLEEISNSQQFSDYRDIYYLIAIAVRPDYRKKGIASTLIEKFTSSKWNGEFRADVFNSEALPLYRKCNFYISDKISYKDSEFYNILKTNDNSESEISSISVYLPKNFDINRALSRYLDSQYEFSEKLVNLEGFDEIVQDELVFLSDSAFSSCRVKKVEFKNKIILTAIERSIDLMMNEQQVRYNGSCMEIIYKFRRNCIRKAFKDRYKPYQNKYDCITNDCYTLIPVTYGSYQKIIEYCRNSVTPQHIKCFLANTEFRQKYECGIIDSHPFDHTSDIALSNKMNDRIERYAIGYINLILKDELQIGSAYISTPEIGGTPNAFLTITIDKLSNCGVVALVLISNSMPLSVYLDGIIAQQILVQTEQGTENLFHFLSSTLEINISGNPKTFITVPENEMPNKRYLASLLLGERYYELHEGMGNIIDSEINSLLSNELGVGQYEYAKVYAYRNTVINITKQFSPSIVKRIGEECITVFFIEMILMYEAALCYSNSETVRILTNRVSNIKSRNDYLKEINRINLEFGETIAFWDTRFKFPSSQKSVEMLTGAFRINELRNIHERNSNFVNNTLNVQANIADYDEANTLNFIILVLTMIQLINAFPTFYGITSNMTINEIHIISIIATIVIPIVILRLRRTITLKKMIGVRSRKK